MKNMNRFGLGLALGLGLFLSNLAFAQAMTQSDQSKTADSCCAMACCSHDSTSMKDSKEHSSKHESCCSGDSCDMKMKEGAKNHSADSTIAGCCGCCGDSCDTKVKDGTKSQMDHSTMSGCCGCCGDSCQTNKKEMKHKEKTN
jgi:hypothetical protein